MSSGWPDAPGYRGLDLDVLLARLVFVMFTEDADVSEKTNEQRNAPGRRLAAPRCEEARRLFDGAVQQGLGPLIDVVGGEAELLEQDPGRG